MGPCLDENTVLELCEGSLDAARASAATVHLDACGACRRLVALVAGDGEGAADAPLAPGATLGRHVILEAVGAGAMGFVYAAYDPELHRKVALKLLRPDLTLASGRERLFREARAMARLAHPNVITVHDVGAVGDRVFIAMEFVDGGTLADWLARTPRTWREVLGALRQAGEGLAAAHQAGIVHRDFKPDNVLVGGDGRVRVTDFGLARAGEDEAATEGEDGGGGALPPTLTQSGAVVGTPAYMAPEQLAGGAATALSDQYGFCVALYEALHGVRPPAAGRRVASWLDRVVARGLRADPSARFPSMRALLDALAAGPPLGRRRVLGAAVVALLVALAGFAALRRQAAPVCSGAEAAWGEVWGEAERGAVRVAMERAGPSGGFVFAAVDRALTAYRGEWTAMHKGACEATRVRGEQSEAMLDLRMMCLADRRRAAAALASTLASLDPGAVAKAPGAAERLPSIESCADARGLAARVPPPEGAAQREAAARAEERIAEANALADLGFSARGLSVLAAAEEPARASGYALVEARRLYVRGRLEYSAGEGDGGEATLHAAAMAAEAARDDGLLADAWTLLGRLLGFKRSRPAEGKRWLAYADAVLLRLGGDEEREINRLNTLAVIAQWGDHRYEDARALFLEERALVEKRCARVEGSFVGSSPEPPASDAESRPGEVRCSRLADLDAALAGLLLDTGHAAEAIPIFERVRAARERVEGPDASSVGNAMANEGTALTLTGRPAEGLELIQRARAANARTGRDNAWLDHRVAQTFRALGRFEEALASDRSSLEASRRAFGEDNRQLALPLAGMGEDLLGLVRAQEAIGPLERAVALQEIPPSDPQDLAWARFLLARALWDGGGDRARARALAEQAREGYVGQPGWMRGALDAIDAWLAAHPRPR
jgi:tetratricopeptide (TPR) repeat protein/predicted Ser/Thr protein kinase